MTERGARGEPVENREPLVEQLIRLGFSQYEARAYVGLLIAGEQTGYGLANATGVPQPKIYETLHRLAERGVVSRTSVKPAHYVAVPAEVLLGDLERDFAGRLRLAREEAERLPAPQAERPTTSKQRLGTWNQVLAGAIRALDQAAEKVYLSGRSADLKPMAGAVRKALGRGVAFVVIHFGPLPFAIARGSIIRHASTEGSLYASRRAHHLALVADSRATVWAFARNGTAWQGIAESDEVLAAVVKGYIRHDIMIQRIFADLPDQLTDLYGPGLQDLATLASGRARSSASEETA
jgi:HTH-type transcriptional regulator, sugar sensing transcriptional regulator